MLNAYIQTHQYYDKYIALEEASILAVDGADTLIIMGITNDSGALVADIQA